MSAAPRTVELGADAGLDVLGVLGQGAQAVVHHARRDGVDYAVKVLHRDDPRDPDALRDFRRQAALLACADHPGLPRVHLVAETPDGRPYVVMDLFDGERLDLRVARRPLTEPEAVRLALDLAGALAAAHGLNLVHRDVKPENILISAVGAGRLVDFGLAVRMVGAAPAGPPADEVAGTLAYSPPEQTGMLNRAVDARSDLYSLGAVLFESVTGEPPYAADDLGELLHLHATAPVPDPRARRPELSEVFAEIVRRLLAKDPDDRYQSAGGLVADLERLAAAPGTTFPLGLADGPATLAEPPLVGRDAELTRLRERWRAARDGRGGVAVVRGVTGSGKTRVAAELAAHAEAHGGTVLRGAATAGDPRPLAALRGAIDDHLRRGGTAGFRVRAAAGPAAGLLQAFSPAMAELLGTPAPAAGTGPEQFTAAVAGLLTGLARGGPVLLHLDDAHLLDETTGRVLARAAAEATEAGLPLLLVLSARDAAAVGPATRPDTDVVLSPLTAAHVAELLRVLAHGLELDPAIASRVAVLAEGNPFHVVEYLRAILDAGLLRPVWGRWVADHDALRDLALPGDAAELLLGRTRRLAPEDQLVLRIAALCGAQFRAGLVAEVAGVPEPRVLDVLAASVRHGTVEPLAAGGWAFRHASIPQALTAELAESDRQRWHDAIADVLARSGDPTDAYALARHCAAGRPGHDPGRLVRAARAAGERALAEYAPGTALDHLDQARAVAAEYGVPLGAGFDRLLGLAYHRNGRFAEALDALHRALDRTSGGLARARLHQLIAQVQESLGLGEAVLATAEEGLAALGRPLPRDPARLLLTSAGMALAGTLVRVTGIGRGTARGRVAERLRTETSLYYYGGVGAVRGLRPAYSLWFALRHAYPVSRIGPGAERSRSLASLVFPLRALRLRRAADGLIGRVRAGADRLRDPEVDTFLDWMDALSRHAAGEDDGGRLAEVLTDRRQALDAGFALDGYATLMWDQVLRGEVDAADATGRRRREVEERGGHGARSSVVAVDACLLALRGRPGEAASLLERHHDPAAAPHEHVDLIIAGLQGAYERDDLGPEFDALSRAFDAFGRSPADLLPAQAGYYVWLAYGRLERARRDPAGLPAAREAVGLLRRAARRPIIVAHRRIAEAFLAYAEGKPEAALAALADAEPALRRVDAPLPAYESGLLRARCLAELGVTGEAERQARAALDVARRAGWPHRCRRLTLEFGLADVARRTLTPTAGHRRSSALEQVSLAASRILDPAKLTRIVLDETVRLLGAERALLFLVDPSTGALEPYAGRDSERHDLADLAGYSTTAIDRVRHSREPLVVTGTEQGAALGSSSVVRYGLRSILVAPLQLDERLLGVVYLDSRVAKGVFTVDDVDVLAAITHHVAVALETARAAQLEVAVATANRQRDLAEALGAAMARFTASRDPEAVLRELLRTALESAGGSRGWVLLGRAGGPATVLDGPVIAAQPALSALFDLRLPRLGGGSWTGLLDPGGMGNWLVMPLETRDGPAGALVLAAAAGGWTDGDLGVVAALAGQAMVAYENARLVSLDALTGVANRRHFFEQAAARPVAAAFMVDIDHFKRINDRHGHQAGDDVIRAVAQRLAGVGGLVGRYGGEEFAVLLADDADFLAFGERLRRAIADEPVATRAGAVPVMISVGVTWRSGPDETIDVLLGRADAGLYAAKQAGRNRVVAHQP